MNSPPKDITLIHKPQSVAKWWVMVGIALGPSLGGVIIGIAGWRAIFWVN